MVFLLYARARLAVYLSIWQTPAPQLKSTTCGINNMDMEHMQVAAYVHLPHHLCSAGPRIDRRFTSLASLGVGGSSRRKVLDRRRKSGCAPGAAAVAACRGKGSTGAPASAGAGIICSER